MSQAMMPYSPMQANLSRVRYYGGQAVNELGRFGRAAIEKGKGAARLAGTYAPMAGKVAGVGLPILGAGIDFVGGLNEGEDAIRAGAGAAGSGGGAAIGALVGSALGPVGTVVGGLAGGAIGGWLGDRGDELVRGKYAGFNDDRKQVEMSRDYQNAVQSGNQYQAANLKSQMEAMDQPGMPQLSGVPNYNMADDSNYKMMLSENQRLMDENNPLNPLGIYQTAQDQRSRRNALFGSDLVNRDANRALGRSYFADNYKNNMQMGLNSLSAAQGMYSQALQGAMQAGMMRY